LFVCLFIRLSFESVFYAEATAEHTAGVINVNKRGKRPNNRIQTGLELKPEVQDG